MSSRYNPDGTARRGTTNRDARGSAEDRRTRKRWLLAVFGDGETAPCFACSLVLTFDTLTVDRIVPGCDGGRYVRGNIRPACAGCNSEMGGRTRRRWVWLGRSAWIDMHAVAAGALGSGGLLRTACGRMVRDSGRSSGPVPTSRCARCVAATLNPCARCVEWVVHTLAGLHGQRVESSP